MEALKALVASVPEWHTLLDDLGGKIQSRQLELAQVAESRPSTRSLKNKGSTESLRPKDNDETLVAGDDAYINGGSELNKSDAPILTNESVFKSTTNGTKSPLAAKVMPPLPHHSSAPGPLPPKREPSQNVSTPSPIPIPQTGQRKRKTASMASGTSQVPKYRTRSMIIVYYDSAVQIAFEELVKHISGARNQMRKGKMAARMASMRRMAEMEVGESSEEENDANGMVAAIQLPSEVLPKQNGKQNNGTTAAKTSPTLMEIPKSINGRQGSAIAADDESDDDDNDDYSISKLKFISTRRMGPSRDSPLLLAQERAKRASLGNGMRPTMGRGASMPLAGLSSNIYDELDTGLEWCQSMCERAAHQFLRDGDCSDEIQGIKRRLGESRSLAEKELFKDECITYVKNTKWSQPADDVRTPDLSRGLKAIQMRKPLEQPMKDLGHDNIDIDDDEGFDEDLPKLEWVSARNRLR